MTSKLNVSLTIAKFLELHGERLQLQNLCKKKKLNKKIVISSAQKLNIKSIQKKTYFEEKSIQIIGSTVVSYMDKLDKSQRDQTLKFLSKQKIPFFILAQGTDFNKNFINHFEEHYSPLLFVSKLPTKELINEINEIINNIQTPMQTVHGVFLNIKNLGTLILGKSGIGKSECALDLIIKGSSLIADDVINIMRTSKSKLVGTGPDNIKYLMEIRGIGIINIKDLFGTKSVMNKGEIDMVVELDHWNTDTEYERLGIEPMSYNILGVEIPYVIIPVSPGRNIATVVEVAVRNQMLKNNKEYSAIEQIWK